MECMVNLYSLKLSSLINCHRFGNLRGVASKIAYETNYSKSFYAHKFPNMCVLFVLVKT